jgi:hypothetical protein
MADMQEVRWKEFEDLGEEAVRKRIDIWDEEKAGLARQWLARNAPAAPPIPAPPPTANDLARRAIHIASTSNTIAWTAFALAVIALLSSIVALLLKAPT